jgi:CBS domain containing-hemolysin-like protein
VKPVIVVLNAAANGILRLFKVEPKDEATSTFTLDEVATIVTQSTKEGVLSDGSGALNAAFEFTTRKVKDIAVPLAELIMVSERATSTDVERAVTKHGFSRYVVGNDRNEPVGYVHLKDVLDLDGSAEPIPAKRVRQLVSIFEDTDLEDALATMRGSGAHLARSFTATGETIGVLFLEDILEELVGEVQDATRRL